jgi:hypothetical protein
VDILVSVELDTDALEERRELPTRRRRERVIGVAEAEVRVRVELGGVVVCVGQEAALDAHAERRDLARVEVERVLVEGAVRVLPWLVFGSVGDVEAQGFVVLFLPGAPRPLETRTHTAQNTNRQTQTVTHLDIAIHRILHIQALPQYRRIIPLLHIPQLAIQGHRRHNLLDALGDGLIRRLARTALRQLALLHGLLVLLVNLGLR